MPLLSYKENKVRKYSLSLWSKKSHVNDEGIDGYDWDESQPKWPLVRVMNVALTVISVIVWALILFRIFASSGGKFEEMILLNDRAGAIYPTETSQVLRIHSSTDDAENGVVVEYPVYLEKAKNLQLTARINRRVLSPGKGEMGYTFILRESGGEESKFYTLSYHTSQKKFNYTFYRLAFEGIELDSEKVYTLLIYRGEKVAEDGTYSSSDADFRFTVLNSETYCKMITPEEKVFKKVK